VKWRASPDLPRAQTWDEARKAINEAKKLEPDNLDIVFNEVGILEAEGKMGKRWRGDEERPGVDGEEPYSARRRRTGHSAGAPGTDGARRSSMPMPWRLMSWVRWTRVNGARATAQVIDTWRQAKDFTKATEESEAAKKKYPDERIVALRGSLLADMAWRKPPKRKKPLGKKETDRETNSRSAQLYERRRLAGDGEGAR
jgi:hypothetical protein